MKLYLRYLKEYRKSTITTLLCFSLIIALLCALLILAHTNHRTGALWNMLTYTPADVRVTQLDKVQIDLLKEQENIFRFAVFEEPEYVLCDENRIYFQRADESGITLTSRLEKGRMPEKENEIVAEKWVLLNLGKSLSEDQMICLANEDTGELQEYRVVGILSDVLRNKQVGLKSMYSCLRKEYDKKYTGYINYRKNCSLEKEKKNTADALGLSVEKIKNSLGRENMTELIVTDAAVLAAVLLFFAIIFSGLFRIQMIARQEQYGVLRAIGMKKKVLIKNLWYELGILYLLSLPVGWAAGCMAAWAVTRLTGDAGRSFYFYGEPVRFVLQIPVLRMALGVSLLAAIIAAMAWVFSRRIYEKPIIEVISNEVDSVICKNIPVCSIASSGSFQRRAVKSKKLAGFRTVWVMSVKYAIRDLKTSIFLMLTVSMGVSLFYGLVYQVQIAGNIHYETKEMCYLNGEYSMSVLNFQRADYGISRESAKEVADLEQVKEIETAAGLPIRVADNKKNEKNQEYYSRTNQSLEEFYGYGKEGNDGEEQVYKSVLYGYNDNALKKLRKYLIEGDYQPEQIREDEVILCVMRETDEKKGEQSVGYYKKGKPLVQYHLGEKIKVKYRVDLNTGTESYEAFKDNVSDYSSREYKIIASVSFPYILDATYTVYPIFITRDRYIQSITENSAIQSIYVNGKEKLTEEEKLALEEQLIQIGSKNPGIQTSTRSLIPEREQADLLFRKEMVNLAGIALVFFILALTNIANNIKFRFQTRKKELCILRAVGMKYRAVKQMAVLEIMNISGTAVLAGYGIAQGISRYLYSRSELNNFGYIYQFELWKYLAICLVAMHICGVMAYQMVKNISEKSMIGDINAIE